MADTPPDFTPVTLITGFLGSGKTTLLQRLLLDPALSDTAVLINEFGSVSTITCSSGKSSGGYCAITHALRHSDIWSTAAYHSGDMGFELCYLPDMPAVLRALAGAENSIER